MITKQLVLSFVDPTLAVPASWVGCMWAKGFMNKQEYLFGSW